MFANHLTDVVKLERIALENVNGTRTPVVKLLRRQVRTLIEERAGGFVAQAGVEGLLYDAVAWFETGVDLRPRDSKADAEDILTVLKSDRITPGTVFSVVHAISSPRMNHHVEVRLERRRPPGGDG